MPRAGWCRECGEWIWVDEEGACQHGHGPECVAGIYDARPAVPDVSVGQGEPPASFNRFNWGAFLLPVFWGLAYGVWPVVSIWLLSLLVPLGLGMIAASGGSSAIESSAIGITIISEVASGIARLYIGANANRLLWSRERIRLELVEGSLPRVSVSRFVSRQRVWAIVGWSLMAFSIASVAVLALLDGEIASAARSQIGITKLDAAVSIVWLLAEIGLGVWLAIKMRQESTANPSAPAEDPA